MSGAGVPAARVRVLDPHEQPLECFWRVTKATGMQYLRSPAVHNLDLHAFSMRRFAKRGIGRRQARFVFPYDRPGLDFFRLHTEHVIRANGLDRLRIRGSARRIARTSSGYAVETDDGVISSTRVVLALGLSDQLCAPRWASKPALAGHVEHVFAPSFRREKFIGGQRSVAIVGGGISAAQLASALAKDGVEVAIVARHPPRVHRFDSDPKWLGPIGMKDFSNTSSMSQRRSVIAGARHRGSMPPEIAGHLKRQMELGHIRWIEASVVDAEHEGGSVSLVLDGGAAPLRVDGVILATGFEGHRPGGRLLDDDAIDRLGLPCADCGYPVVSPRLEWAEGLFVSGPLAELELGPSARNIAGARQAASRLLMVA